MTIKYFGHTALCLLVISYRYFGQNFSFKKKISFIFLFPGRGEFSAPVQTGHEAHPASYKMGTGFPVMSAGDKGGRCVGLKNFAIFVSRLSRHPERVNLPGSQGPVQICVGIACTLTSTGPFTGVKLSGRGVDHPPYIASSLKKAYGFTSTTCMCLHRRL
jgi:hypothetical protein